MLFYIDFLSILAPSWLPTWGHLGSQDASKSEKMAPKNYLWEPRRSKIRSRAFLASILGGSGLDFRRFLDDFWSFLAYFGHVFGCSFLSWFSLFLVRSSTNFAKKIQELAEDKAENPRTCRGQSREQNPYERLPENSNLKALFLLTTSLIATLQTPKTLGGGTPPRGASIERMRTM